MKTNIEIDDTLVSSALQATGLSTPDEVIELALTLLIQLKHQEKIKAFRGKLHWDGDLEAMRTNL